MALTDLFIVGAIIFGFTVVFLFVAVFIGQAENIPQINATYTSPDGATVIEPIETGHRLLTTLDWAGAFFAFGLVVAMIISGFLITSHPAFFFLDVLILILWLFLSPYLSNGYLLVLQTSVIAPYAETFPMLNFVVLNLPVVGLVAGALAGIFTHGKGVGGFG